MCHCFVSDNVFTFPVMPLEGNCNISGCKAVHHWQRQGYSMSKCDMRKAFWISFKLKKMVLLKSRNFLNPSGFLSYLFENDMPQMNWNFSTTIKIKLLRLLHWFKYCSRYCCVKVWGSWVLGSIKSFPIHQDRSKIFGIRFRPCIWYRPVWIEKVWSENIGWEKWTGGHFGSCCVCVKGWPINYGWSPFSELRVMSSVFHTKSLWITMKGFLFLDIFQNLLWNILPFKIY